MKGKLEEKIENLLLAGKSRAEIVELLRDEDPQKLLFQVNNISDPARRGQYQLYNLALVLILAFATTKKLIASFAFGSLDLFLILSLVAPIINVYLLREILRFRRVGYHFLFVLSILSLLLPENHFPLEAGLQLALIALSGFLSWRIFAGQEAIIEIVRQP